MADTKQTTGYIVDVRQVDGGARQVYAVLREYRYRGKYGAQLVTIYEDASVAEYIRATLDVNKRKEV
ncbi:hypothetical protein [Streptomyces sp. NPDC002758]